MRWFFLLLLLVVVAGVARLAYVMVPASGVFLTLEQTLVENCTRVDVAPGTEDVTIHPQTRIAYVSAADRRDPMQPAGGIYAFSIEAAPTPSLVSADAPDDFRPHGISLWTGDDGAQRLFAINHPKAGGHTVEIFDVGAGGVLAYVKTVAFDEMYSPNDLVAVGPEQFYASNDRGFVGGVLGTLEAYLALPLSNAVYWDGEQGSVVASGLAFANGVNKSPDGGTIYIAQFLGRSVGVYDRDIETGALTHVNDLPLETGVDNIEVTPDGTLYIGGNPRVLDFLAHAEDPNAIAASQVVRLDPQTGETRDVFVATDGTLSGSSVGAVLDNTLIVGAVFEGHVLVCPLDS
ncbi:hypothetical protein [Pyruvatibacter sp.]|uniref:hypothetical protein n=1 Tax=Pyruvatibacter sp. TaxID=1981328 RepID=UPI0032EAE157